MSKKSPPRTPQATRKHSRGGTLVGLFIGLVIGLVCAFGVAWYLQKTPLPFLDKTGHPDSARPAPQNPPGATPTQGTPLPLPGKPGEKPVGSAGEKPRFDFYKILPGGQETTSTTKPHENHAPQNAGQATPPDAASAPVVVSESFYLQAGSFQKSVDADNLKAKLALMGLETNVLEANVPDKGVMFRVRVGPFATPDEMNRARHQLSQNGIQASLIKIKEKPQQ
jgi:cell division protein FtsN